MRISSEILMRQFHLESRQDKNETEKDINNGIRWLENSGSMRVIVKDIGLLPVEGQTSLPDSSLYPAIAVTNGSMSFFEGDNGITTGWDGDTNLLPTELCVARVFLLMGKYLSPKNPTISLFVPKEKESCVRATVIIKNRFPRRVTIVGDIKNF